MKEETHKRLLFFLRIIMAVIIGLALILIIEYGASVAPARR